MAQRTTITLTDDLDGGDATQTITFGYQGRQFDIDLSDKNAAKLERALEPFIGAARKSALTGGAASGRRLGGRRGVRSDVDPKVVREWARANGVDVPARGRISASVVEQFRAAGN